MFSETADLYDCFYAEKDYRAEAAYIADIIRGRMPSAESVLDVACGTGEHARILSGEHGFRVDGIDLEHRFVELAAAKNSNGAFHRADMTDFDLGRTYDAVVCLFSSIGYVHDVAALRRAITTMTRHVTAAGILVVEPWFEPGAMENGFVTVSAVNTPHGKACRMTHTSIRGRVSLLRFEYLIGTTAGVHRASETHELTLFSRTEMSAAFHAAGLTVAYDSQGPTGRGLYVGTRA